MKTPPFFIGCLLLFWGIESTHLVLAVPAALLVEGHRFINEKWTLSDDDFIRISDLTSVILLAGIALILLNKAPLSFFRETVIWQPLILLPLMLAQLYSTNDKIIIGTRIGAKKQKNYRHPPMDFALYYITLSLLAAGAANSRSAIFFPAIALLLAWLLLFNRGKSFSIVVFLCCFVISGCGGYFGYLGFEKAQKQLRRTSWHLLRSYYSNRYSDPYKTSISTGSIGKLKLSGEIIIRIPAGPNPPPPLLTEASYNTFSTTFPAERWINTEQMFELEVPVKISTWNLFPPPHPTGFAITLEQNIEQERGLLARPPYSYKLFSPKLFELERNKAGTLRAVDCAPIVTSTYYYTKTPYISEPPTHRNLVVPDNENEMITRIAASIWNKDSTAEEKLRRLQQFFLTNFSYTLDLQDKGGQHSVLARFLLSSRQGHCELFASATALLLRAGNIPTRYVTGYAVEEYSKFEKRYLVRARHAHAWCEAYINGSWVVVDNTPPDWLNRERTFRSFFEPAKDLYSYLRQLYKRFQVNSEQQYNTLLSIIVVILSCLLIFSIYRRLQMKKVTNQESLRRIFTPQDSPFILLEQWLETKGIPRQKNEPFTDWLTRIQAVIEIAHEDIITLHALHQKLRFDNANFTATDQTTLVTGVNRIISTP